MKIVRTRVGKVGIKEKKMFKKNMYNFKFELRTMFYWTFHTVHNMPMRKCAYYRTIVLEQLHLKLYPATMLFKERGINTIVCFVTQ